jgi:uncharacterized protein
MRDVPDEAARILREETTLALATAGPSGSPAVAPVFFVADDDGALCWLSARDSAHSVNVEATGRAAGAIWPRAASWEEIRGVQVEGDACRVDDPVERGRLLALYLAKFPLPAELGPALAASALYALRPSWLRLVDNRVAFSHREERGERCPR